MAQNLIDLRRRIKSVKGTQKTTKAMKTVSAAKLRRSVTDINRNRPVLEKIESILRRVGQAAHMESHPFLEERKNGHTVIVVISTDKGLCGAFNTRLLAKAESHFHELQKTETEQPFLITVGNKAFKYFSKRDYQIKKSYQSIMSRLKYENAFEISQYLQKLFLTPVEDIKKIEFITTEFVSASKQEVKIKRLFPIKSEWEQGKEGEENRDIEYIFEPSAIEIFNYLLPKFIDSLVYQTLLQSSASEHAARMVAMDLASRNASDMIRNLTLIMNKMRQASITNELLEIMTATEALKK
jgi:F-type H+-transporting ATPase subunit gamma